MNQATKGRLAFIGSRVMLGLVMVLGALGLQAGGGTLAYFTSVAASTGNTFTAGTVTLKVADANDAASAAITASIGATAFKPGDTVYGHITVSNAGTLPYDYGLKYTATNPTLRIYKANATTDCTAANVGSLQSIYGATSVSLTANTTVFDSGALTKRPLASGATEILCLAVAWPLSSTPGLENAQQGGTGNIDFNFDARQ